MKKTYILLVILLLALLFYWFQIRPVRIRNYCDRIAWDEMQNSRPIVKDYYDWKYTQCLHNQGFK